MRPVRASPRGTPRRSLAVAAGLRSHVRRRWPAAVHVARARSGCILRWASNGWAASESVALSSAGHEGADVSGVGRRCAYAATSWMATMRNSLGYHGVTNAAHARNPASSRAIVGGLR